MSATAGRAARAQRIAAANADRLEDVAWMAETGEGLTRAAQRLGITPDALEKWCDRHAPNLARRLRAQERNIA